MNEFSRSTRLFLHDPRCSEVDGIAGSHHILYDRMLPEIKLDASCTRASDLVKVGRSGLYVAANRRQTVQVECARQACGYLLNLMMVMMVMVVVMMMMVMKYDW